MKTKKIVLMSLVAVLTCGLAAETKADPILLVDQQNLEFDSQTGTAIPMGRYFGQSFTPQLDGIDAVDLAAATAGVSSSVFIELIFGSGTAGTAIASTQTVTFTNTGFDTVHFEFPSTITLIPNQVYTLAFNWDAGDAPLHLFSTQNPYSGGITYDAGNSARPDFDLVFTEGLHIPEPSSTAVLGVCLIGAWMRRRRH